MSTRNLVFLIGRLAADPELRYLPNGSPVATFGVAVNRATRKPDGSFEDSLDGFFDCEVFGAQALALAAMHKKGAGVQVAGSLRQVKFETKGDQPRTISRVVVRVDSIAPTFDVRKESQTASEQSTSPAPAQAAAVQPQPA